MHGSNSTNEGRAEIDANASGLGAEVGVVNYSQSQQRMVLLLSNQAEKCHIFYRKDQEWSDERSGGNKRLKCAASVPAGAGRLQAFLEDMPIERDAISSVCAAVEEAANQGDALDRVILLGGRQSEQGVSSEIQHRVTVMKPSSRDLIGVLEGLGLVRMLFTVP